MKFKRKTLQELVYDEAEDCEVIHKRFSHKSRWSIHYTMVFKFEDKLYQTSYKVGATEQQDEEPYEYEPDEIECPEVEPFEATITLYRVKL